MVFTFNAPVSEASTHLYNSPGGSLGAADVTVVGASTGSVKGSLVVDPTNPYIVTFVKTAGVLATDSYTVTVTTGVTSTTGAPLSSNYSNTLSVTSSTAPVLSVPSFARGAGQTVNVPNTGSGIPVSISNATGVTQVSFTLTYNPTLLTIAPTGALTPSSAATAAGLTHITYSITSVDANHSVLTVSVTGGTGLTGDDGCGVGGYRGERAEHGSVHQQGGAQSWLGAGELDVGGGPVGDRRRRVLWRRDGSRFDQCFGRHAGFEAGDGIGDGLLGIQGSGPGDYRGCVGRWKHCRPGRVGYFEGGDGSVGAANSGDSER